MSYVNENNIDFRGPINVSTNSLFMNVDEGLRNE
jgi:hypothetical protein